MMLIMISINDSQNDTDNIINDNDNKNDQEENITKNGHSGQRRRR